MNLAMTSFSAPGQMETSPELGQSLLQHYTGVEKLQLSSTWGAHHMLCLLSVTASNSAAMGSQCW